MKKNLCALLVVLLLLTGCGKQIPKLENGQEAVVTFNDKHKISVDDLYNNLKSTYGLTSLVVMIDTYVLETTFKDYIDTAKEYADNYIKAVRENYNSDEEFLKALQSYLGVSSVDAYKNQLYLSYMQTHATEEYAKLQITDDQIQKYYDNEVEGDIEVSHILITPEVKDDMDDNAKKEAETNAKNKAEELLKTLKGVSKEELPNKFAELAKENSKDDATKENGGSLGKINKTSLGDSYKELVDAAYSIKDGELYKDVVTTELGYHIILRTKSYEKESLDKMKESIIKTLSDELIQKDSTISTTALQHYRKELGVEIEDSELQTQYANYIQNSLTQNMQ